MSSDFTPKEMARAQVQCAVGEAMHFQWSITPCASSLSRSLHVFCSPIFAILLLFDRLTSGSNIILHSDLISASSPYSTDRICFEAMRKLLFILTIALFVFDVARGGSRLPRTTIAAELSNGISPIISTSPRLSKITRISSIRSNITFKSYHASAITGTTPPICSYSPRIHTAE
ncbi:uncharacterized protein BKA78DRAFT_323299 [Phyllosticta capitalensis]|uniref:uncharacterized protein n=1 Tax=Phyllosticta capitalensis TaxID=121624 RepID=UPI00313243B9